mgnify:CR=1 FL=1
MKRARIIVLAIAVLAAGAAMLLANSMMSKPRSVTKEVTVGTVDVLVAKADLRLGDAVKASDFRWQAWPTEAANPTDGYITKTVQPNAMAELDGSIARAAFLAGEPIKPKKLIKANEGGVMAAILPAGMRAISVKIDEYSAVAGFIMPNDRVDVIKTGKDRGRDGRKEEHTVETILHNVRVLAIGQEIETKDGKKFVTGKSATLELTPVQSERLAVEGASGDLSLTLRSLAESLRANGQMPEEAMPAKQETSGVKMLRYGTWSRVYGTN